MLLYEIKTKKNEQSNYKKSAKKNWKFSLYI